MKPFKTLVFAALLMFSISFNTFGGEVEVPGAPKPLMYNEEPLIADTKTTGTNTQETGVITSDTSDYLFYEMLAALLSVY